MRMQIALDRLPLIPTPSRSRPRSRPYADWIEVGTSLVKRTACRSSPEVAAAGDGTPVLADLKTADDARPSSPSPTTPAPWSVTVLGLARRRTLSTCVRVAGRAGPEVMVDLMELAADRPDPAGGRAPQPVRARRARTQRRPGAAPCARRPDRRVGATAAGSRWRAAWRLPTYRRWLRWTRVELVELRLIVGSAVTRLRRSGRRRRLHDAAAIARLTHHAPDPTGPELSTTIATTRPILESRDPDQHHSRRDHGRRARRSTGRSSARWPTGWLARTGSSSPARAESGFMATRLRDAADAPRTAGVRDRRDHHTVRPRPATPSSPSPVRAPPAAPSGSPSRQWASARRCWPSRPTRTSPLGRQAAACLVIPAGHEVPARRRGGDRPAAVQPVRPGHPPGPGRRLPRSRRPPRHRQRRAPKAAHANTE